MPRVFALLLLLAAAARAEVVWRLSAGETASWPFRVERHGEAVLAFTAQVEDFDHRQLPILLFETLDRSFAFALVKGEGNQRYQGLLGPLEAGTYEGRFLLLQAETEVKLSGLSVSVVPPDHPDHPLVRRAPFIVARSLQSDLPLLLYAEQLPAKKGVEYTLIFANEDGGTPTFLLYALWGRTTDIEWVYRYEPSNQDKARELIQTKGHATRPFQGEKIADHPILYVCTNNNMVCDVGEPGPLFTFFPLRYEPGEHTRELVQDQNPWIYQAMCGELVREGKVSEEAKVKPPATAHPSRYLFFEYRVAGAGDARHYAFVETRDGRRHTSHFKKSAMAGAGEGFRRTAVLLPPGATGETIQAVGIGLLGGSRGAEATITRLIRLSETCQPHFLLTEPLRASCTQTCSFSLGQQAR